MRSTRDTVCQGCGEIHLSIIPIIDCCCDNVNFGPFSDTKKYIGDYTLYVV